MKTVFVYLCLIIITEKQQRILLKVQIPVKNAAQDSVPANKQVRGIKERFTGQTEILLLSKKTMEYRNKSSLT